MEDQRSKISREDFLTIPRILISASRNPESERRSRLSNPKSNYSRRSNFSLDSKIPNVPSIIVNDGLGSAVSSAYSRFTIGSPEPLELSMDTRLSIERSRHSSIVSFDDYEASKETKPKSCFGWLDSVYELFKEDADQIIGLNNELFDDITYEESEHRIFVFCTFLSILILPIATTLTYLLAISLPEYNLIEVPYIPKGGYPHVALLFANGALQVYKFITPEKLELHWDFQVQKVRDNVGYFGYIEQRAIHVIYPDTINKKQNTVITSQNSHHLMPNKKIVREARFAKFTHVRVGNYLWIFGGEVIVEDNMKWGSNKQSKL